VWVPASPPGTTARSNMIATAWRTVAAAVLLTVCVPLPWA
jgi:hypothetical protein